MRAGRPMDGDSQKGGALVWFRTAQDTGGEYSLAMGWGNQSTLFFRTITPATLQVLEGEPDRASSRQREL